MPDGIEVLSVTHVPPIAILQLRMLVISILAVVVSTATDSADAAELTRVRVGHQGVGRIAAWNPVQVDATGLDPSSTVSLVVTTLDARGNRVIETCRNEKSDSEGRVTLSGVCRMGRLDAPISVAIATSNGTTACSTTIQCGTESHTNAVRDVQKYLQLHRHNVPFLLTIGDTAGIPELLERANDASRDEPALVGLTTESVAGLPSEARGYGVFTTVVINGPVSLSPDQLQAMQTWVHSGGHLIVSCNEEVGELLRSDFGKWLKSVPKRLR